MYDLTGDIHGYAVELRALLAELGYEHRQGAYRRPERKTIFLGSAGVTMSSRFTLTVAFAVVSAFMAGCTHRAEFLGIEVPASATSVEFLHPAPNDAGVRFVLQTQPSSYQYVNRIRDQIKADGYDLCRKSAISTWQPLPERGGSQAYQNDYWLVEMYATRDKSKFVLLRVDQDMNAYDQNATQRFLIASEIIGSGTGKPNLSNIDEFCDL